MSFFENLSSGLSQRVVLHRKFWFKFMNNNDIEGLSVLAVKESLIKTGYLEPYINENDKQPSWDGYVNIYSKKEKTKANLTGRMPVQVKGTIKRDFNKEEITYTTTKKDLQNYLYDGGIIFFVVYLSEDGSRKKIYYTELTPIKLRNIIKKIKKDKKNIRFYEFPEDSTEKATIFLNCYNHCQKQVSFAKANLPTIEELQSQNLLVNITTTISGYDLNKDNLYKFFLKNKENYFYAKIKGSAIPQPLDILPTEFFISKEVYQNISVNRKPYYDKFTQIYSDGNTTNIIGSSLKIIVDTKTSEINVKYKDSHFLYSLTKDLEFILSVIDAGQFELDGNVLGIKYSSTDLSNFNIEKQRLKLDFCKKLIKVLNTLDIQENIDLSKLTLKDEIEFHNLITALVDHQPVTNLKSNLPSILPVKISNLNILLIFKPVPNHEDTYNIFDFFTEYFGLYRNSKDGNKLLDSQFSILSPKDFVEISNIKFDALLPSFQKLENTEYKFIQANNMLLKLLLAFDESTHRNSIILNTAYNFSEWLRNNDTEYLSENVKLLNHLQVVRRQRELTTEEKKELINISESSDREDERVGAFLLLDYQEAAKTHFDKLDSKLKETFKTYPIFHFYTSK